MIDDDNSKYSKSIFVEKLVKSKVIRFLSKDTSTKIAIATATITLGSFAIKILGYLRLKGFLSVFSISAETVNHSTNRWLLEFLINALLFIGLAVATSFIHILIEFLISSSKHRKVVYSLTKYTLWEKLKLRSTDFIKSFPFFVVMLIMILFINFIWLYLSSIKSIFSLSSAELFFMISLLSVFEMLTAAAIVFFDSIKRKRKLKNQKSQEDMSEDAIVIDKITKEIVKKSSSERKNAFMELAGSTLFILFFIYSGLMYLFGVQEAQHTKSFSIIEDRYAVIYQNDEYYWTVIASESNATLLLNVSRQKIMKIDGVETCSKNFDDVIILYG